MQIIDKGTGEPEIAVVGSIHGDEPAGKEAINRILSQELEFKKPVRFVIANEEALEENVRFIDTDLNRSFPGDPESDSLEERLAAELLEAISGMTVLDIHTTRSYDEAFATMKNTDNLELVSTTGVDKAVYFPENSGVMIEHVKGTVVEAGRQGSEKAVENAVKVIKNFLAAQSVLGAEYKISEPEVYRYYDTVEGNWNFLAENFRKVEVGDVYAKRGYEELVAEESFYPVLMSTNGYEGQLGYKADKVEL